MVHFRFTDNGAGIAPQNLAKVFERGFSTKERATGLGLHWCANGVAAMGGGIRAHSAGVGRGATIELLLPSDAEVAATSEEAA